MSEGITTDGQAEVNTNKPASQQVRLRITDQSMRAQYANAFRSNGTPEEVLLDFGVNTIINASRPEGLLSGGGDKSGTLSSEIHFDVHSRIIMNLATTKRLAILLGNLVREHEARFGEVKLAGSERGQFQAGR